MPRNRLKNTHFTYLIAKSTNLHSLPQVHDRYFTSSLEVEWFAYAVHRHYDKHNDGTAVAGVTSIQGD